MSNIDGQIVGIFDSLVGTGLIKNNGRRQKNLRRVAAALRVHAQRRKLKREAKQALEPLIDSAPRRRRPGFKPIGERRYDKIVRLMKPGLWYARGDLTQAAGFGRDARGDLMRSLLTNALATRAPNPQAAAGTECRPEPQWFYRLTPKGEVLSEICRLLA
jgi:hypothetical protein